MTDLVNQNTAALTARKLRESGLQKCVSVPCSTLAPLTEEFSDDLVIAPNEGEAVAYAVGSFLAGSKILVAIQNSGLGNCVNAITSLSHPYDVPISMVVGWRGHKDTSDETHHKFMGNITTQMLELCGVETIDLTQGELERQVDMFLEKHNDDRSVALLVRPGLFGRSLITASNAVAQSGFDFRSTADRILGNYEEIVDAIAKSVTSDTVVVTSTGFISRVFSEVSNHSVFLPMMGSMGHAVSLALGLAEHTECKIVVIEGDGSFLMRPMGAVFAGTRKPDKFCHVVLDNRCHNSTGGQPSNSEQVSICGIAAACGYASVTQAKSKQELSFLVGQHIGSTSEGPIFIHAVVNPTEITPPRISMRPLDFARSISSALGARPAEKQFIDKG